MQEVFRPTASLLQVLVSCDDRAAEVARTMPAIVRQWDGIHQVLSRKADMEKKYLDRLDGERSGPGAVCLRC